MDRREFMIAATAAATMPRLCPARDEPHFLGLQLYSVRDLMAKDVYATLDLVADVGYTEVEFAGYFSEDPAKLRKHLENLGMVAPAAHFSYSEFEERPMLTLDIGQTLGHTYINVPSVPSNRRQLLDDYREHAENFNRWGETCKRAGLKFAYHNHDFEFEEIDGVVPFDLLLGNTDPELVFYELDLCWTTKAGHDPASYFKAWPGRFPMWHLKDVSVNGDDVDIGTGTVDFARAFEHVEVAGLRHGFVERDNPEDARESMARNFASISPYFEQ